MLKTLGLKAKIGIYIKAFSSTHLFLSAIAAAKRERNGSPARQSKPGGVKSGGIEKKPKAVSMKNQIRSAERMLRKVVLLFECFFVSALSLLCGLEFVFLFFHFFPIFSHCWSLGLNLEMGF